MGKTTINHNNNNHNNNNHNSHNNNHNNHNHFHCKFPLNPNCPGTGCPGASKGKLFEAGLGRVEGALHRWVTWASKVPEKPGKSNHSFGLSHEYNCDTT
jgi:hypothetical protein